MPSFEVTICKTVIQSSTFTVKAANEDKAQEKVDQMIADEKLPKDLEWEIEIDEIEIESIDEE